MSETAQSLKAPVYVRGQFGAGVLNTIWSRAARLLRFAASEPFFQFLALGLLIWAGVSYIEGHNERYVIHIGSAERQRLARTYREQYNQAPTAAQLRILVDQYIKEEISFREGLALGLDKGDEIVRRRIAQKFEFIQQDLGVSDDPSPGVLNAWFENHKRQYLTPLRATFTQVYFSSDKGGSDAAKARALRALKVFQSANGNRVLNLGDQFPGPSDIAEIAQTEAERIFGESAFTANLYKLPEKRWSGPFRSGYGWHLVYITQYQRPVLPSFGEVKERVLADYQDEQRRILNAQAYGKLFSKYQIVDDRGATDADASTIDAWATPADE